MVAVRIKLQWLALIGVVVSLSLFTVQARLQARDRGVGVALGDVAPAFTLPALGGGTVSLRALRGRPVDLDFFTTFCQACRDEAPDLEAVHQALGSRAAVIGVDLTLSEASVEDVRQFVRGFGVTYPVALDRTGRVSDAYLVNSIPTSVFIGPHGHVRAVVRSQMDYNGMMASLRPLLVHRR